MIRVAMADTKLVQMNLLDGTLRLAGDLQGMLGAKNRTDAIVRAIEIAHPVVAAILDGKRVVMIAPNGDSEGLVVPGIGRTVTYYGVLHGEPRGHQTFAPMRNRPGVSRLVFEFQGPELSTDAELLDYFNARFLPLTVEKIESNGQRTPYGSGTSGPDAFRNAKDLVGHMNLKSGEWGFISTRDGQVLDVLPRGVPMSPMPFAVVENWASKGALISRYGWEGSVYLVGKHAGNPGAYLMRKRDGRIEPWTPTAEDKAATDWGGFGPFED
jgi:hypothetical protein